MKDPHYRGRRLFLQQSALASGSLMVPGALFSADLNSSKDDFMQDLRQANDERVTNYLKRQTIAPGTRGHGCLPNQWGIDYHGGATAMIVYPSAAYVSSDSMHYKNAEVLAGIELAIEYLLRTQHEDGTVDLYSTNFHSTPDLGFVIERLSLAYHLLQPAAPNSSAVSKLKEFMLKAGDAMTIGGIHTPNHRWIVSMALAQMHELFPNQKYVDRVDEWLFEKIDIDADGQYTERSTSVYSPLTNMALITIARILEREDLYDAVRRNLDMSLYYFHPNGEIVTEASRRQDQYVKAMPGRCHFPYLYMAHHDKNGAYGATVNFIRSILTPAQLASDYPQLLVLPHLAEDLPTVTAMPSSYHKHFAVSDLVRIREGAMDATMLAKNHLFFTMTKGDIVVQGIRFASAFFGKGQFEGDTLINENGSWSMEQKLEGPYWQPYPVADLPDTGIWEEMPRENRPESEVQHYHATVRMTQEGKIIKLEITAKGTDHVPFALEISLRSGGSFSGDVMHDTESGVHFLTGEEATYSVGSSSLTIKNGMHKHTWTELRGAKPRLEGSNLYLTGYTPIEHTLILS